MQTLQRSFIPARVLVINFGPLSDVVFSLPALKTLRRSFPSSHITFAGTRLGCELVSLAPDATDLLPASTVELKRLYLPWQVYRGVRLIGEIRRRGYDLTIDLQSTHETSLLALFSKARLRIGRLGAVGPLESFFQIWHPQRQSHKHKVDTYLDTLRPLGIQPADRIPALRTNEEFDRRADELLKSKRCREGDLLVGLHAGSDQSPIWTAEQFVDLARRLQSHFNVRVVVGILKDDRTLGESLAQRLPKDSIFFKGIAVGELVSVLARCAMMISGDAGPGHIAAALDVPTLIIGCPITRKPLGDRHAFVDSFRPQEATVDQAFDLACEMLGRSRTSALFQR